MASKKNANDVFVSTYARDGAPMVRGSGTVLVDAKGKQYLDFGAGIAVTALGHSNPKVVAALKKQGAALIHASNLYHMQPQIDLAGLLVKHSFGDKIFFCNSGTEANEAAIKFARKWATKKGPRKFNVLSFTDAFHGRTYGALSATPQKKFQVGFEPMVPGFYTSPFNDIGKAKAALGRRDWAAIMVEPVQGEGGVNCASRDFLTFLRTYATKHKIALVYDEVQCGMGRTGTLWSYEQYGVKPDMMTLAKPLGGGLPLGAVVCTAEFASCISPGDHGTTFGGNPLACALGCVVLGQVSRKAFLAKVGAKGEYLRKALAKVAAGDTRIDGVRGVGLLTGVRMKEDPAAIVAACREKGLLVLKAGHNTVRFIPPLTVSRDEIDKAVKRFGEALSSVK